MHRRSPITAVTPLAVAASLVLAAATLPATAQAGACPNEQFRSGRSAALPDCRAYELVTPEELVSGSTADMTFENAEDEVLVAPEGEHLALRAQVAYLGPNPSVRGTNAVFSRTTHGWQTQSVSSSQMAGDGVSLSEASLFSPDLSEVGFTAENQLTKREHPPVAWDVGPAGGPYTTIASIPSSGFSRFEGANPGTTSVPAFSDVLFFSHDHAVLPPGPERERVEEAQEGANVLYEWSGGGSCEATGSSCRLVNVNDQGQLLNRCGAVLGSAREGGVVGAARNAVSADGAKVFFSSPDGSEEGCGNPQLYMRMDGRETVEVSAPQGVSVPLGQRGEVEYLGASADGARVFFQSPTALTSDAIGQVPQHLYEYNTQAPAGQRLTLIGNGVGTQDLPGGKVVVAEDGSAVYYNGYGAVRGEKGLNTDGIFRYDTVTGVTSFVAVPSETVGEEEPMYGSPNGQFLVFPSGNGSKGTPPVMIAGPHGLEAEPRGAYRVELYRYDAATGGVTCVSCGSGVAARGVALPPNHFNSALVPSDGLPTPVSISEDGQRAFFQTSAKLVAQDTNESTPAEEVGAKLGVGSDVYEWEAPGTEETPGSFCGEVNGCTHLISAGEEVGPENFLGASKNGRDVFFTSAAQLVPQATPEFTNIYDARIDGGFPVPSRPVECLSCQGVSSPPPVFGAPSSETFEGAGNPPVASPAVSMGEAKRPGKRCAKGQTRSRGRCLKVKGRVRGRSGRFSSTNSRKGGK